MKNLRFFKIFDFFEIFDDVDDVDDVDDNGNVTFTFLSSNYVENCICPKSLLLQSVSQSVSDEPIYREKLV